VADIDPKAIPARLTIQGLVADRAPGSECVSQRTADLLLAELDEKDRRIEALDRALTAEVAYRRAWNGGHARSVQDGCWRELRAAHAALEAL
jgi:hypothetical protein